ncbi:MAG: TIGR02147 family protein [Alphaproteobacteria bacterium]|nr:TIGR02147 family protein [Alphaproteobacteria bacterium]
MTDTLPSPRRSRGTCPVDVFRYLDVRRFLSDYYDARKSEGRGFSYRAFSRRVGLRSPNHLKRVIDGGRPLTAPMAVKYAEAIGLDGDAHAYFIDLAAFSRVHTTDERNAAYARLVRYRKTRDAHRLDLDSARYHGTWYLPAIRELVSVPDFQEDPGWVARSLVPQIGRAEAAQALSLLLELGLVERGEDGALRQTDAVITTGPETRGLHIANFHRTMMERAADSIDLVDRAERDISSLTFSCTEDALVEVKRRLVEFRRELIALLSECEAPDRVVQLNFQLFPLSRPAPEDV